MQELGRRLSPPAAAWAWFCREPLEGLRMWSRRLRCRAPALMCWAAPVLRQCRDSAYARDLGYYVLLDSMRGDVTDIAQRCAQAVFGTVEEAGPGYQPYPCDAAVLPGWGKEPVHPGQNLQSLFGGGAGFALWGPAGPHGHGGPGESLGGELWGKYGYSQVAAVVGAPYPEILRSLRAKYDRMFFLVPGYGAQGGTAKSVQHAFDRFGHGAVVCAARSILGAWKKDGGEGRDYVERAVQAAEKMKKDLGKYIVVM